MVQKGEVVLIGRCILGIAVMAVVLAGCLSPPVSAATRVAYGGLATMGPASETQANYPRSYRLLKRLQTDLFPRVQAASPEHYDLFADRLLDRSTGASVALALVLDHEKVSLEQLSNLHKVTIEVSGQVVVYDFNADEKAIIASYPVVIPTYVDTFDERPSDAQLQTLVERYWLGGLDDMPDLLSQFVSVMESAPVKQKFAQEFGIGQVRMHNQAWQKLPHHLAADEDNMEFWVARNLASSLAAVQGLSVSYRPDSSIADMALRFAADDVTEMLSYSVPNYVLEVDVIDFPRSEKTNQFGTGYRYGATVNFRLIAGGKVVFDRVVDHPYVEKKTEHGTVHDDWAPREMALLGLFHRFAEQAPKVSRRYCKDARTPKGCKRIFKPLAAAMENAR